MTIQQMFVAFTCLLLATQQIAAVVNNQKSASVEETLTSKNVSSTNTKVPDSVAAGAEQEAKRREAPILAISNHYGLPLTGGGIDSYVPSGPSNPSLPIPVYGVPDSPSNHIVYPAPPPDIPPPISTVGVTFGIPSPTYGVPHSDKFGSSHLNNFISPPSNKYLPPIKPHKHFSSHSFHSKPFRPRPQYGPPHKPIFVSKLHKPKPIYGPPKTPLFVPQKQNGFKQQSVTVLTIPSIDYGAPDLNEPQEAYKPPLSHHYGPPEPIPHGPPHPGVPAPPTPPDIKYDGWQPIPGLVSRPPSDSYGVPKIQQHHGSNYLHINADFTPPPIGSSHGHQSNQQSHVLTSSHAVNVGYSTPNHGVSDSYGAPLNAVTGSGAIDSSSGDAHHDDQSLSLGLSAAGINGQSHLSVVKSIGYELFPNSGTLSHIGDSYSTPPASSYSSNGPYPAAQSFKTSGLSSLLNSIKSHQTFHSSHGSHNSHSSIGLIPPSGVYGAPPSSHYGTPLLSKPSHQYGAPLNALKINPPKHPVVFRDPVPTGLIESIGQHTADKDAHGIIENSHSHNYQSGPTYIPPPIPDITKPVKEDEPPAPSGLYSLPHSAPSVSFQSHNHGINSFDLSSNHFSGHSQAFDSYTAPLGSIDGSYSLPLHSGPGYSISFDNSHSGGLTVGIDNSLPPFSIDLTSSTSNVGAVAHIPQSYTYHGHDCKSHGSQPLPSLSYGVPSVNSYTAALSSLTTNIGGAHPVVIPPGSYGPPDLQSEHSNELTSVTSQHSNDVTQSYSSSDLQTDHSTKVRNVVNVNSIDSFSHGKSLAQKFGPDSELIKSQDIDISNIPLQGNLGSYTLQIQSSDNLGSKQPSQQVSHSQVLNGGLLESILAAIEQPQRKDATILGRPFSHLKPGHNSAKVLDSEGQHSVTNAVVLPAPVTEATSTTTSASESETEATLRLINNNEIALYFTNNLQKQELQQKNNTQSMVRNGQQYGNYVSFKKTNASFAYGKLDSDKPQETPEKD